MSFFEAVVDTHTVYEASEHLIRKSNENNISDACFATPPEPSGWRRDGGWTRTLGLNPSASAVDRSSAGAAGFGSIGMGSGAFNSQSSVPPPPTASSEWWGHVASGNTLIPGAGVMNETGESLGRNPFKVPKAPVFDGT